MLLRNIAASEPWFKLMAVMLLCTRESLALINLLSSCVLNKGVLSQAVHEQLF